MHTESGVSPVLADATHAWCALLHAQAGRLAEAEAELAQHRGLETGPRSYVAGLAWAQVASLRGDAGPTLAAAEHTLTTVAGGPILFRYWAGATLVPALTDVGLLERAHEVLAETLALVDEHYPGDLGRYARGRLLGLRAWLAHLDGASSEVDQDLSALWQTDRESLRCILKRDWERLRLPVWGALERGALEPDLAVDQIAAAFPAGLELVAFLDHPVRAVRGAALVPAVRSGDPRALSRLEQLKKDADAGLAAAAGLAAKRLVLSLPPLRFELLGRFARIAGAWPAGEGAWGRPVDARLVRLLLVRLGGPVSEDEVFEALWPGLPGVERAAQPAGGRVQGAAGCWTRQVPNGA